MGKMIYDDIEKNYNIMIGLSDGLVNMISEEISYKESYNKDGISFDLHGRGVIKNLKFPNGTSPSMIESAINGALERSRIHFEKSYFDGLPVEAREARQVSENFRQVLRQTALDMQQSKKP